MQPSGSTRWKGKWAKALYRGGVGCDGMGGTHVGLVMAGGRGTRMGGVEKALLEIDGRPMVEHVLERLALVRSLRRVICVTSPYTPTTTSHLRRRGIEVFVASGRGHYDDLHEAMESMGSGSYAAFSADVPFIDPAKVEELLVRHHVGDLKGMRMVVVTVPVRLAVSLGVRPSAPHGMIGKDLQHSGIKLIHHEAGTPLDLLLSGMHVLTVEEESFAVNVNTPEDLEAARRLARRFAL
ncbi:MAG: NTP transferase domain-containing protein [Aigarchaeota archaeon]|nr:NTP transferase domain-containing protein [Candidatus Calditenuis fumarioli]